MHKYDVGIYTVTLFDSTGRKAGQELAETVSQCMKIGEAHVAEAGGSFAWQMCGYNSARKDEKYLPKVSVEEKWPATCKTTR